MSRRLCTALLLLTLGADVATADETTWLDTLDLAHVRQGWGTARSRRSVEQCPLSIGGRTYERGIGTHAESGLSLRLDAKALRFDAAVGVDDGVRTGHGSVEFLVVGDHRVLWRSGPMRAGEGPRAVEVDLRGVRNLNLVVTDGEDGEDEDHADWADARIALRAGGTVRTVPFVHQLRIDPRERHQVIDGFGASDCWSFQKIGTWAQARKQRVADLLFSSSQGIGLSIWRFNVGAGPNPRIQHPWRTSECFETRPGQYDWSRQAGQRWFLQAAKARGVKRFVAFAISPPARMTRSGYTNGTSGLGSTNLGPDQEPAFAGFLADVVKHFRDHEGIAFEMVSPVNEPQWEWNENSGHEGSRASNADLRRLYGALARALAARDLDCGVLGPESGNASGLSEIHTPPTAKYGAPYGAYAQAFCPDAKMGSTMRRTLASHSYWSGLYPEMIPHRRRLRDTLSRYPGWRYWQTEFCVMRGPRGESGWGRDLTMKTALWVARIIHLDLTVADASAWHWWTAVCREDFKSGLLYTDYKAPGDPETIVPARTLWVLGNYSRFVRPGMHRVGTRGANRSLNGLLASAYVDPVARRIVIVLVNMRAREERVDLSVGPGLGRAPKRFVPFVTSDRAGDDLRRLEPIDALGAVRVPGRSVVTIVGG